MMIGLIATFALIVMPVCGLNHGFLFASDNLTAEEIVDLAIARSDAQYESLVDATFESDKISSIQSLDSNGETTKTDQTRFRQYPLAGALFEEMVEKNGLPLSEKDLQEEKKRRSDFIREVEQRISRGEHPQPESEPGIRFNHEFVDRYQLKIEGVEMIRMHRCWVISFEPRAGDLPVRTRMDRALNQSTGKFWISQDDYGLARLEFALREPFKYWGGFLAVIRNTDGRLDYKRVEPNVWAPSHFDLKLDLKIMMVKNIRRLISINWTNYRRSVSFATASNEARSE
jgi:uncharacterized protein YjiS (DUF1127 family)